MLGNRACLVSALVLQLAACGGREATPAGAGESSARNSKQKPGGAPETTIIAEFADQKLTLKDLNDYLNANLYLDDGVEDISASDLAILQSRLFDSFVDEALLLLEANQAGIQVSSEEVEAYMQANAGEEVEDAKTEAVRREMARRDLTIQKLRSTWVETAVTVTPEEVARYAAEHREDLEPQKSLVLRSLMFPTEEQAKSVGAAVAVRKMTFDQAVETPGVMKSQAQPNKITLDSLPQEVRDAVENLEAGQISKPVMVNGRPFLFYVVSWVKPTGDVDESIRQRAEASVRREKQEEASRAQVLGARQRIPTRVHVESLPFEYVPAE